MLAAEYVLGTLDGAEREAVAARLAADDGLALAVRAWEDRLSPLVGAVPDVEPPAGAYAAIASRLFGPPDGTSVPAPDPAIVVLRRRVRRWQGAAAGFALLAAAMLGWIALREAAPGYA
ncbi:hypothetical protein I3A86_24110, partial [Salmonella enterica]|nr:hypothetical protein [Salmonella enterica]